MPRDGLSDPEEAIDVWPRGGCWLEDEACQFKGLERLEGLRAGKRQAWTPIRSHGCVALGCLLAAGSMPRDGLSDPEEAIDVWPRGGCWLEDEACQFKGLERLEGLAAG